MPRNDYRCPDCNHTQERFLRPTDPTPVCAMCGGSVEVVFNRWRTVNSQSPELDNHKFSQGYWDPTLKIWVSSRRQRANEIKRQGLRELDKYDKENLGSDDPISTETDEARQKRWQRSTKFADARISDPDKKREALNDLKSGKF